MLTINISTAWCHRVDSNHRHAAYETAVLPLNYDDVFSRYPSQLDVKPISQMTSGTQMGGP